MVLAELVTTLQRSLNILQKREIQTAAKALRSQTMRSQTISNLTSEQAIRNGDDCAAIPDGDRFLLLAAEGMSPEFVERDPWFAGWCAVMVNVSDVAAMGGWPIAMVDAIWSVSAPAGQAPAGQAPAGQAVWEGMTAAAQAYGVPIVGGHTNSHSPYPALAAAILGRAEHLITSFDAHPGDVLLVAIDLRGEFYKDYPFWNAATTADPDQLQGDIALLPKIAQARLCCAGKDISMGGLVGTLLMLAETSGVGAVLELDAIASQVPREITTSTTVAWEKWLTCFPSFGYLLAVPSENVTAVTTLFQARGISCVQAGLITAEPQVYLVYNSDRQLLWNLQTHPLTGFSPL